MDVDLIVYRFIYRVINDSVWSLMQTVTSNEWYDIDYVCFSAYWIQAWVQIGKTIPAPGNYILLTATEGNIWYLLVLDWGKWVQLLSFHGRKYSAPIVCCLLGCW